MIRNKKGQVWVETVIYTLIGLVLIGTVLAFAVPFINEQKDRVTIEKTSESMNALDNVILNTKGQGIGNKREFNFLIGQGGLTVDGADNSIKFKIEGSRYAYSEPGFTINIAGTNLKANTRKNGDKFDVTLTLDYDEKIDIVYDEANSLKVYTAAPNPYNLIIENLGKVPTNSGCTSEGVNSPDDTPCSNNGEGGSCRNGLCVPTYTMIDITGS
jgi:type II secretory pathway pseudopilin PulG